MFSALAQIRDMAGSAPFVNTRSRLVCFSNLKFARQDEPPYDVNFKFGTLAADRALDDRPEQLPLLALELLQLHLLDRVEIVGGGLHLNAR
jgi:hypothetical protein